jgi:hypothetical protein
MRRWRQLKSCFAIQYKHKPIERALPPDDKAFEFERSYAGLLFNKMNAVYQWRAGRPSDFGLCEPEEDLPLMMAFMKTKRNIELVQDKEQARKLEDATAKRHFKNLRGS